jgi:hypothetical protein
MAGEDMTDDDWANPLFHVAYEHVMFEAAAERVANGRTLPIFEQNAWVEVVLLHVRALTDFYLGADLDRPQRDDLWASKWSPSWPGRDDSDVAWLEDRRVSIHKRILHVTTERTQPHDDAQRAQDFHARIVRIHHRWRSTLTAETSERYTRHIELWTQTTHE